jgi:hypothetical protein
MLIGQSAAVAVCYLDSANSDPVAAFQYTVSHNGAVVQPVDQPDASPALDDNPDANAGATVFTSAKYQNTLGTGWSCVDEGIFPTGAYSGPCSSTAGPQTLLQGPLGVVTFQANAIGSSGLSLASGTNLVGDSLEQLGGCGSVQIPITCLEATILVTCVQPDADCDSVLDGNDNCPTIANLDQTDTDIRLANGPNIPNDDVTLPGSAGDLLGDACDDNDDNDAFPDIAEGVYPMPDCPSATAATSRVKMDTDGDHLTDKWECDNDSDPASSSSKFLGLGGTDGDGDHIPDLWEVRGYDAGYGTTIDSDGDGCHDMVETASIDHNKSITDSDRLAVARRALGIWGPNAEQDYALDLNKNGAVEDADRLFVARAALLPTWLPKSCP